MNVIKYFNFLVEQEEKEIEEGIENDSQRSNKLLNESKRQSDNNNVVLVNEPEESAMHSKKSSNYVPKTKNESIVTVTNNVSVYLNEKNTSFNVNHETSYRNDDDHYIQNSLHHNDDDYNEQHVYEYEYNPNDESIKKSYQEEEINEDNKEENESNSSLYKKYNFSSNIMDLKRLQHPFNTQTTVMETNISKNKSRISKSPDFIPGKRLYDQYFKKQNIKQKHIDNIKKSQLDEEMKDVTFKPQIDKKSEKIANHTLNPNIKVEDRLNYFLVEKRENLFKERTKSSDILNKTFHPEITDQSTILAAYKRRERKDQYELLRQHKSKDKETRSKTPELSQSKDLKDKEEEHEHLHVNPVRSFVSSENTFSNFQIENKMNRPMKKAKPINKPLNKKIQTKPNFNNTNIMKRDKSRSKSPNITHSKSIISNTTTNNYNDSFNLHNYLYEELKLRELKKFQEKKAHYEEKYPFKPTIPESSKNLIQRNETKEQFINRLYNSRKKAEELIIEERKQRNLPIDPKTGKELFKPTITRGPLDPNKREVTVNLDGFYDGRLTYNKERIEKHQKETMKEIKKHWIEKSMNSIIKMKINKYKEIFDMMDSDRDGKISSNKIKLARLSTEVLEALTPILESLQVNNNEMDFKEFCLKANEVLRINIFSH